MSVSWRDSVLGHSPTDLRDNNEVHDLSSARNRLFHLFDGMVHARVEISHFQGLNLGHYPEGHICRASRDLKTVPCFLN